MNYINTKYLGSSSLLNDSLKQIRETKDPRSKKILISNIQICLNLHSRLKSVKFDSKIETQHLALFEQKCLLEDRRLKCYEVQVEALRLAMKDLEQLEETGRELILNMSLIVNEIQAQGQMDAKINFFFRFIEKECDV